MLGFQDFWKLLWPLNFGGEEEEKILFEDLIAKALEGPLDPLQQEKVVVQLENDPKLVYNCGLTPKNLPDLVENNYKIAAKVLIKLVNSPEISEYIRVLVNMEASVDSLLVVNKLTAAATELPNEFLYAHISNFTSSCQGIKDISMQSRLARYFCVHLLSLIHNEIINVDDIFIEVEAFCIKFSHVREASGLLRLLKTLE